MQNRLTAVAVVLTALFSALYMRLYVIVEDGRFLQAANMQSSRTLKLGAVNGNIYDRNFMKFVNNDTGYLAAVDPTSEVVREILPHVIDKNDFYSQLKYGSPFVCRTDTDIFSSGDITAFEVPERYGKEKTANHVIGYICEGEGVTGIESAYDEFLRSHVSINEVTYDIDGLGRVLEGMEKKISYAEEMKAGVVLTLDKKIQAICELAGTNIKKGAVVVMDVNSGDILAMASFPDFDPDDLGTALENKDSPLINRCLYSYSVGSIFKLVTALSAFEQDISESYSYTCTGYEQIKGQVFMCHDHSGHGKQDMTLAMKNSCNTYFIKLAQKLDPIAFHSTAVRLGFGTAMPLALGINCDGGNLQTEEELEIPAEMANFSFGQGKLTASPLQICRLTAAIANGGKLYIPRLVIGTTENGKDIDDESEPKFLRVFDTTTAFRLQDLMTAAVNGNTKSNARPSNTKAAGKTSTAQTGLYDENGEELCHGWITGFFPLNKPEYAVTVLCEDGGYGNECAAPVFREIAEKITAVY